MRFLGTKCAKNAFAASAKNAFAARLGELTAFPQIP